MSDFWRNRRVFITGHTGFKGGWLSIWLQRMGAIATGYSLPPPTRPSLFERADVSRVIESLEGDVCDLDSLTAALATSKPDIVVHMAAQPLVRSGYADPVGTYRTNVLGTVNLLQAVRAVDSVRAVVNVTTDKCYENRGPSRPFCENDALGGSDPYSCSKACSELVTSSFRDAYFAPDSYGSHRVAVATARAGNVIGGGDWGLDRLVPDIVRALGAGTPVPIRNPDARRPWQHVLEPLSGYLRLAEHLCEGGPSFNGGWNFGPMDEHARPVSWIADQATALWGEGARWVLDGGVHPHEAETLRLDCSKARSQLGWQPRMSLATALEWTIGWYQDIGRGADPLERCRAQIGAYERLESP